MPLSANVIQGGLSGGSARAIVGGAVNSSVSAAGTTQGTATAISADVVVVTTVGSGAGVVLPLVGHGSMTVFNAGANVLKVYPGSGASITPLSANTAMTLPINTAVTFTWVSVTQIVANLSA
jgi:hypothetical protein